LADGIEKSLDVVRSDFENCHKMDMLGFVQAVLAFDFQGDPSVADKSLHSTMTTLTRQFHDRHCAPVRV
jgi:hypothetical protein